MDVQKSYQDFSATVHERAGSSKRIIKAQIELTYGCNLHCVHCYTDPLNQADNLRKQMTTARVFELLDKLYQEGILWVCFTGGEVFFRKDFLDIYEHAWNKGFLITIFTNATLLQPEIIDRLKSKPPFSIEVTCYGASKQVYESVTRVQGSYDRFIRGIELLHSSGLPIKLKASVLTLNVHELREMRLLASSLGVVLSASGIVYPKLNGDLAGLEYRLSADQLVKVEYENAEIFEDRSITDETTGVSETPHPGIYRCHCGKIQGHIDPEGNVGPCTWSRHGRFPYYQKTLDQGIYEWADQYRKQEYTEKSACRTCQMFYFCDKLPEISWYETGNVDLPVEALCEMAKARKQRVTELDVKPKNL